MNNKSSEKEVSHRGTFISFKLWEAPSEKRKTAIWRIHALDGMVIGEVRWYAPWRKYCFSPLAASVYEQVCLREIADFIVSQTEAHKRKVA